MESTLTSPPNCPRNGVHLYLLPKVASCADQEAIVTAAESTTDLELFIKEGRTWVGSLGFTFDEAGRLVKVETTFTY